MTADTLAATSPATALALTYPAHWRMARLGDVCERTQLVNPSLKPDAPFTYIDVSSVSNQTFTIVEPRTMIGAEAPSRARKAVRAGDVLFATVRPTLRRVALVPNEFDGQIASTGYCVIRAAAGHADPCFIYFYILSDSVLKRVDEMQVGATYPAISDGDVLGLPISLPPLAEQRAIARVLRAAQDAIAARRRQVTLERERKAALMRRLFTYGVCGEPTQQTAIGEMPQSWRVVLFSEVVEIVQGQVDPRIEPYRSMLHVGPENIEEGTGRILNPQTAGDLNLISGKYLFSPDHVLYSKIRPYLRKAAIPWFDGICSADMYPLRPRANQIDRDFLLYALLGESFTAQVTASQDRTGIPKVNRNQLGAVRLPLPPLIEQRAIADTLAACDTHIAALEREIALHEELFRALLEELMSGRLSALPLVEATMDVASAR